MRGNIADGHFYLAGEGVSVHHGWVLGSLKSSMQALLLLFQNINHIDGINKLIKDWHIDIDIKKPSEYKPNLFLPIKDGNYAKMFKNSFWADMGKSWRFRFNNSSITPPTTTAADDGASDTTTSDTDGVSTRKAKRWSKTRRSIIERDEPIDHDGDDRKIKHLIPVKLTSEAPLGHLSALTDVLGLVDGFKDYKEGIDIRGISGINDIRQIAPFEGSRESSPSSSPSPSPPPPSSSSTSSIRSKPLTLTKKELLSFNKM